MSSDDKSVFMPTTDEMDVERAIQLYEQYPHLLEQVLIVIPVRPSAGFTVELTLAVSSWHRMGFEYRPLKDFMGGFIETTRQQMAVRFVKDFPEKKFLIMIDNDVCPTIELPFLLARHDQPVVGGPCMIVTREHGPCLNFSLPDGTGTYRFPGLLTHEERMPASGLVEVGHMGTGAICIRRDVLEAFKYEGEDVPFYIPREIREAGARVGLVKRGEDVQFSVQARQKGFKVYCDLEAHCGHKKLVTLNWPPEGRDPTMDPSTWRSKPGEYSLGA